MQVRVADLVGLAAGGTVPVEDTPEVIEVELGKSEETWTCSERIEQQK